MIKLLGPPPQELLSRADKRMYPQLYDGQGKYTIQAILDNTTNQLTITTQGCFDIRS
jgi:hypothetical protein